MANQLTIECNIEHETERAVLINDGTQKIWLPKSVVEVDRAEGDRAVVYVPEWLANERGLI
jgi:hypothetical protein